MALNYETLIRAASKAPEQRTTAEINDFIVPWLKQSLKKKQEIFQKISDDLIYDICKTIMLERRLPWDVVIRQNDPGDTFYIILQGSVNIYRLDDDNPKSIELDIDTVKEFAKLDADPEQREQLISDYFGNYVVTLTGGSDFGERALITNEPRSATVMTTTPTDLLVVDREVFNRTLKSAHEKELQEKTEFINRCPLFSSWSPRLRRLVSLSLERGRYAYDTMLYKQNTPADAVYFIWSGEVKLTMNPLLHWLQYPYFLPQSSDQMKQRSLDLTFPNDESFAIKRRGMTFVQAEKERAYRSLHIALLHSGDMIGLESFVCDLPTHMNSARCTAPCDIFYMLKHNFFRLQKRHGAQGLSERLREIVLTTIKAYPTQILHLPLFTCLMKRQLAVNTSDEQQQQQQQHHHNARQSWLFHIHHAKNLHSRRTGTTLTQPSTTSISSASTSTSTSSTTTSTRLSRSTSVRNKAAIEYYKTEYVQVKKTEDRLKQWHTQMGDDPKTQIRPLTGINSTQRTGNALVQASISGSLEAPSNSTVMTSSLSGDGYESIVPIELLVGAGSSFNESLPKDHFNVTTSSTTHLPKIHAYTKQEQYEHLRAYYKQALKEFLRRPIPVVY